MVGKSDDDATLIIRELVKGGYDPEFMRIESAGGFEKALDSRKWDLVLADYSMPDFTGLKALDIPFVFVSGLVGEDMVVEAMKAGVGDYFLKDNIAKLIPAVERELKEVQIRQKKRQIEEALEESNTRFRQMVENVHEAFFLCERKSDTLLYMSPALTAMFGVPVNKAFADRTLIERAVHPADLPRVNFVHPDRFYSQSLDEEFRVTLSVDDTLRWVQLRTFLIWDGKGEVVRVAGLISDITDRKIAEENTRESEVRYRMLFESAQDGIALADAETGRFMDCNTAFCRMVEKRKGELVGQLQFVLHSKGTDADGLSQTFQMHQNVDIDQPLEDVLLSSSGKQIPVEIRASHIQIKGRDFLLGLFRDITDRKKAEEDQRRSEKTLLENELRYRTLFEDAYDGIALADVATGRIVDCNLALCRLTGREKEELVGQPQSILHSPEDLIGGLSPAFRQAREGDPGQAMEDRLLSKSGKMVDVEIRASRIKMKDRDFLLGIFRDITERKRMQEQLVRSERMNALGLMASGIAHDFNNALMPIVGFSELLISDPSVMDNKEEARGMVEVILAAGKDARQIVRRMSEVYKKDDAAECEMVNLAKIIENSISLTMPKWKEEMSSQGVTINIKRGFHPVPLIRNNASELREVITNLIFNAVDAMPEGGVITFRLRCENDLTVVLEVIDTGIGMNEETLKRCKEAFFTTKGVNGSGLGLAMVNGIINRHGGTIEIESRPGAGTTIRIMLPVTVETENTEKVLQKESVPIIPQRILVIDDDKRSRNLLDILLKADAHYVEMAENGRKGIDMLRQGEFDLLITDRAMPGMSGDEVAKEAHRLQPGMPIIMLTGFGDLMKKDVKCPVGVSRIMGKPVTPKDLKAVIASVMRKAGEKQQS